MIFGKSKETNNDTKVIETVLTNDSFDSLNFNFNKLDLEIKSGNKFEVKYHGASYRTPIIELNDNHLVLKEPNVKDKDITRWEKGFFKIEISHSSGKVFVTIPENTTFDFINVKSASSDVSLDGISVNDLNLELSSGDVKLVNVDIKKVDCTMTSGDLALKNVKLNAGEINLTSGDFKLIDSQVDKALEVNTVSGDTLVRNTPFAKYNLKSVSGENFIFGHKAERVEMSDSKSTSLVLKTVSGDNIVE